MYFQYASGADLNLISLLPSSLSVFCRLFGISCLGPGRLRQSLFTRQARTPTDDTYCHSLSTAVEGGHIPTIQHQPPPNIMSRAVHLYVGVLTVVPSVQLSMLGSRFAVLMLFTRVFKQWILGVIGKSDVIS